MNIPVLTCLRAGVAVLAVVGFGRSVDGKPVAICLEGYGTIQEAIDANPGATIRIPPGEYRVAGSLIIRSDETGLAGKGTIVQTNPDAPIVDIQGASGVRLEGLTLTRADDKTETRQDGIRAVRCDDLRLTNVRVTNNRSLSGSIRIEQSTHVRIDGCEIINYKRIDVDDRTTSELYGYAFRAIMGDGMIIKTSTNVVIANNWIVERNIIPDEETKRRYKLGQLTEGRHPTQKGTLAPAGDYVPHWHQGSAIVVTSPETTSHVLITGNMIENAAQGVDIHADQVTFSANVIDHAFVGIKCMHGARNVIITNNNVSHNDLWGLVMQPGTASHRGRPGKAANVTRGNIIANNIFSDFGFGHEFHNWKGSDSRNVLQFESGPLPTNPPLTDVVITGNIVYDSGRDHPGRESSGDEALRPYNYAVYLDGKLDARGFQFGNNFFDAGRRGVANVDLSR